MLGISMLSMAAGTWADVMAGEARAAASADRGGTGTLRAASATGVLLYLYMSVKIPA